LIDDRQIRHRPQTPTASIDYLATKDMSSKQASRSDLLHSKAVAFCQAFLENLPPDETLDKFFTSSPRIHEHGPSWATSRLPFLGKPFVGRTECESYFKLLSSTLKFHPNEKTFPPAGEFIVDTETRIRGSSGDSEGRGAVSVVAHAMFESVTTGKQWEEDFIYRLSGFDQEGKIGCWEIWADPLSAWEAVVE
jgi:hypothetical protein